MKKSKLVAALLVAGWLAGSAVWAAEKHETTGPEIKVPEAELEEGLDEEGLKREGNFGKLHLFGYGEMHYNNKIGSNADEIDFHRMVLGVGYDFNERIKFRSEVDFEHAFKEPELEFAHLDFLVNPYFNVRAGSILVPMGVINQHHEPPLFYSVERPEIYRVIIPTSWQEGGAGFFGNFESFDYQIYGMSSLRAVGSTIATSFRPSDGLRKGRGGVGSAPGKDIAGVGRIQYKGVPGLRVGSSLFLGNTAQGNAAIGSSAVLTMVEGDAKYSFQGIDLEGILAFSNLSNSDKVNNALAAIDPTLTNFVGSQMLGWYLEGAYHLFHHLLPETKHDLVVFGRFEKFNTQFGMPMGRASKPEFDRKTMTAGLSYLPIPQVAIKADYMFNKNEANTGTDQFNLGIGFYY